MMRNKWAFVDNIGNMNHINFFGFKSNKKLEQCSHAYVNQMRLQATGCAAIAILYQLHLNDSSIQTEFDADSN